MVEGQGEVDRMHVLGVELHRRREDVEVVAHRLEQLVSVTSATIFTRLLTAFLSSGMPCVPRLPRRIASIAVRAR
jgi:hypothetical protein